MNGPQRNRGADKKRGRRRDQCQPTGKYEQRNPRWWYATTGHDPHIASIWGRDPADYYDGVIAQRLRANGERFTIYMEDPTDLTQLKSKRTYGEDLEVVREQDRHVTGMFVDADTGEILVIGEADTTDLESLYGVDVVQLELLILSDSEAYAKAHPASNRHQYIIRGQPNPEDDGRPYPVEEGLSDQAVMIIKETEQIFNLPRL